MRDDIDEWKKFMNILIDRMNKFYNESFERREMFLKLEKEMKELEELKRKWQKLSDKVNLELEEAGFGTVEERNERRFKAGIDHLRGFEMALMNEKSINQLQKRLEKVEERVIEGEE